MLSSGDLNTISSFADQLGEALLAVDFEWRIIAVNDQALRFAGLPRDEILGRSYWDVAPRAGSNANEIILRNAMAARTRVAIELESGLLPNHVISGVAIPLEEGTAFVFRDVTAERYAARERENALRESEARFRHMADSAPAFIWMTDRRGRVSFANMHFGHVFGRPASDMLGHGWTEVVHPDDVPVFRAGFVRALSAREPFGIEVRAIDRTGGVRWIRCESVPRLDDEGQFLGYTGCGVDITDRKLSEQALRESEERLKATQEHAGIGIAETDREGRFLRVNEAFCRITGYTREDLIGRTFGSLTHEDFREAEQRRYAELVSGARNSYTVEKLFRRSNGELGWVWLTATAIRGEHDEFVCAVRTLIDVTEDKLAEERQQLLIHELNHRVKNTLTTVQSIVVQTLRSATDAEQARRDMESRLLSLARAHDILTRANWQSADLRDIVRESVAAYNRTNIRVRFAGPRIPVQPREALALSMTLHELATNAIKYGALSNETGTVGITWAETMDGESRRLTLRWEEEGGPLVEPPTRQGFGSRLIERSLAQDLAGTAALRFEPAGVVCTIEAVLDLASKQPVD
ncbi:PAS domain S-box protein [Microvirga massiliensis]|uniref:PAS domain S-box protein n=1 Tax=Microvirga massiliensis TaxID=1033741 RepID=UPI00069AE371|nr:PAS domain S-box protein [Microvirga massiliensis]